MLPSLSWGDGVKLQTEAVTGESFIFSEMSPAEFSPDPYIFSRVGVAAWDHPLYVMFGYIVVKTFPFVDSLWLVNFISALFGAASIAVLFLILQDFNISLWASCYACLALAVCHTFWWHSSTPEVYSLFVFLLLVSFYFFGQFESTGKKSLLFYSGLFLGLAGSNHILAFLAFPALGLYYLLKGHRNLRELNFKTLVLPTLGFLLGFSIYIIQFIRVTRSYPVNNLIGPMFGSTFVDHVGTLSPILLLESLLTFIVLLILQFGPVGLVLGILGIRNAWNADKKSLRKIIAFLIVYILFGILYRVSDQFAFFMTSYAFWAMLMGFGSDSALRLIPEKRRFLLPASLGLLVLATPFFYHSIPTLAAKNNINDATSGIPMIGTGVHIRNGLAFYFDPYQRGNYDAYNFGKQTISKLAPNSIIVAEWYTDTDEYFVLRYFLKAEKLRPDVTIYGWPTAEPFSFDPHLVLDVIETSFPQHPIYLASLSDKFYDASKLVETYCIIPEDNLYRLYSRSEANVACLESDSITE